MNGLDVSVSDTCVNACVVACGCRTRTYFSNRIPIEVTRQDVTDYWGE